VTWELSEVYCVSLCVAGVGVLLGCTQEMVSWSRRVDILPAPARKGLSTMVELMEAFLVRRSRLGWARPVSSC
jgi:hypothetical protein